MSSLIKSLHIISSTIVKRLKISVETSDHIKKTGRNRKAKRVGKQKNRT